MAMQREMLATKIMPVSLFCWIWIFSWWCNTILGYRVWMLGSKVCKFEVREERAYYTKSWIHHICFDRGETQCIGVWSQVPQGWLMQRWGSAKWDAMAARDGSTINVLGSQVDFGTCGSGMGCRFSHCPTLLSMCILVHQACMGVGNLLRHFWSTMCFESSRILVSLL
jgi:hypothetical protein